MSSEDAPWNRPSSPAPGDAGIGSAGTRPAIGGTDPAALRALHRESLANGAEDRAWCAAAALVVLDQATADETKHYEEYRPLGMLPVRSRLDDTLWRECLTYRDEDFLVGELLAVVVVPAALSRLVELAASGKLTTLDRRYLQDPVTSTVTLAKVFGWAALVLGVPGPDLYLLPDAPESLVAPAHAPLASLMGHALVSGLEPQEQAFVCGRHLAIYRPEHLLGAWFPDPDQLAIPFLAARRIANPAVRIPSYRIDAVDALARELACRLQPTELEALRAIEKQLGTQSREPDLTRWWQRGVALTRARAGLLLCGDLAVARRVLARERTVPGGLSSTELLAHLAQFSVSEGYFRLRQHLGIAVGADGGQKAPHPPAHDWARAINAQGPSRASSAKVAAAVGLSSPGGSRRARMLIGVALAVIAVIVALVVLLCAVP